MNDQNSNEHKPYVSPAMLSIEREEEQEKEAQKELEAKQLEQKKAEAAAKPQTYQPLAFVMSDFQDHTADETSPEKAKAAASANESAQKAQKASSGQKPTTSSKKTGSRNVKSTAQKQTAKRQPAISVVHDSGQKKTVKPASAQDGSKQASSKAESKPASSKGAAKPAAKAAPKKTHKKQKQAIQPVADAKKKKKKGRRSNYVLYYVMFGIVAVILLTVLSVTVLFPIQTISVVSMDEQTTLTEEQQQEIIKQSGIQTGSNLLRLAAGAVQSRILTDNDAVDAVQVTRKLPSEVVIHVNLATAEYAYYTEDNYYLISENQRVMAITSKKKEAKSALIIKGFSIGECEIGSFYSESDYLNGLVAQAEKEYAKNETDENEETLRLAQSELRRYELLEDLLDQLEEAGFNKITEISMSLSSDISFTYDRRIEVQLGGYTDMEYKLSLAKEIITNQLEADDKGTLNLSVPDLPGFVPDKS